MTGVATGVLGPLYHRDHRGPGDRPVARRHTSSRRRAARRRERAPLGGGRMSVCLPERAGVGQVGACEKYPFPSITKCSDRSVRRLAMTWALSASGKTLVQSLKGRLVVMAVERR